MELTRSILGMMNCGESSIEFVKDRPGHDFRYSLDCNKLRNLGWKPEITLEEGVKLTVDWYKDREDWWRPVKEKMDQNYVAGFWGAKA